MHAVSFLMAVVKDRTLLFHWCRCPFTLYLWVIDLFCLSILVCQTNKNCSNGSWTRAIANLINFFRLSPKMLNITWTCEQPVTVRFRHLNYFVRLLSKQHSILNGTLWSLCKNIFFIYKRQVIFLSLISVKVAYKIYWSEHNFMLFLTAVYIG